MTPATPIARRSAPRRAATLAWAAATFAGLALLAGRGATPPQTRLPGASFEDFKVIASRNIFDPNRSRGRSSGPPPASSSESESQDTSRLESFALLGTLSYENGRYAYFDGSRSEYRAVLKPSDTIAGYTVADVTVQNVKLKSDTNEVVLPVGMQLARENQGPWRVQPRPETHRESGGDSHESTNRSDSDRSDSRRGEDSRRNSDRFTREFRSTGGSSSGSSTNAAASEDDAVLKALLKKREQELNNENK